MNTQPNKSRDIFLSGEINQISCDTVIKAIIELDKEDDATKDYVYGLGIDTIYEPQPINLYINSPGGNLYDSIALFNFLSSRNRTIYTHCYGSAYSGAFLLFLSR